MNRTGRLLGLMTLAGALAGISCTPSTPSYSIKHAEIRGKLANGLRMVIVPDKTTPMVHVAVRYQVGANEDPPGKAGLAHLVEHMMFQHRLLGPDKPATFELIPQVATEFNAFTTWDTTHYYLTGRKEDLDAMLRIESARMGALCNTIPESEFQREREVVRNEIRQRGGTPDGQIPALMLDMVYPPGHPYHETVGGNDAQLSSIEFKDVCDFMTKYYTPDRATVVVVGNIDKDDVAKKIQFDFGAIQQRTAAPRVMVKALPELKYGKVVKEVDTERSQVLVMWRLPPRSDDRYAASQSMIGAVNQRLNFFNSQYDFATSVGAFSYGGELAPFMVVAAELYGYGDVDKVLGYIWKSTSQIHRGFEDGMFGEETAALGRGSLVTAMESLSTRGTFLADQVQFQDKVDFGGTNEYLFYALQQYDKLDGSKFRSYMKSALGKSHARVLIIKSSKKGIKGDKRSGLRYSAKTHDTDMKPIVNPAEAKHPLKAPSTDSILKNAVRYELGNGMKIVMLQREGMPIVSTRLIFGAGSAQEPANMAGLANIAAGFLQPPLGASFMRTGVRFGGSAGSDTTTFSSHGINIYLETEIKGLERIIKAGEINQNNIESWQHFQRIQFGSKNFRRERAFRMEVAKAIYGPDHPYTVSGSATEKSYKKIGRDNAMAFVRKHYRAKNATFIIVGNFDVERAKRIISSTFGSWSGGSKDKPVSTELRKRSGPEYFGVLIAEERPQMTVSIAYPAPAGIDGQEAARQVLATMLNLRMAKIRTELGSTYGTYAFRRPSVGPSAYIMGGTVDATRGAESVKAMRDAISSLRRGEKFDADFAVARRTALKRLLAESTDTRTLARRLAAISTYNLPPDYYDQQIRFIAAVSPAQVRGLIETELRPEIEIVGIMAHRAALEATFAGAGITTVRYIEPQ